MFEIQCDINGGVVNLSFKAGVNDGSVYKLLIINVIEIGVSLTYISKKFFKIDRIKVNDSSYLLD